MQNLSDLLDFNNISIIVIWCTYVGTKLKSNSIKKTQNNESNNAPKFIGHLLLQIKFLDALIRYPPLTFNLVKD